MDEFLTYGLFGRNIADSPAPQIFNAFFEELGVRAVYMPFPVGKDGLIVALPMLRSDFAGFNVGAPFKLEIAVHLDALDGSARTIGAVNTVKAENKKLIGYNTDGSGFERSIVGFIGNMYDRDVLLIGSGGTAHAIADVLLAKGAFLTIISRDAAHAATLRDRLQSKFNKNRVRVLKELTDSDKFFAAFNATGTDIDGEHSRISIQDSTYGSFKYAYDLRIGETGFLKKAGGFGAGIKDGFDMLFYQSVASLEVWFGKGRLDVPMISKVYDNVKASLNV
jgi:shikimate dehydrogenase